MLREGVLTGSPEQKEEAAKGLGLVIRLTSADALRPSVVSITGPLIRILGDRFNWTVKAALLETLSLLLGKASELGTLGFHVDPGEQVCLQETKCHVLWRQREGTGPQTRSWQSVKSCYSSVTRP